MKKILTVLTALTVLVSATFGEEIKIATFKGMAQFVPAVTKILTDAGYDVKSTVYDEQGELIASLAKTDCDIAFFLAQPIITGVKGAQFISARLMSTDFVAVTLDPAVSVKSMADLKKYKVCVVKDQPGQNAAVRGCTDIVYAASEMEQFKKLKAGEAQVAISVRDLVVPMTKANGINNAIVCEPPVMKNPTFLAVSAKAAGKKAALDAIFQTALNDGTWNKELGKLKK